MCKIAVNTSSHFSGVQISNITKYSEELSTLGASLKMSPSTYISYIHIIECPLSDAVVRSLAEGIAEMKHGLQSLALVACDLTPKRAGVLFAQGLSENYCASACIKTLNLSRNKLGNIGSKAFEDWAVRIGESSQMERVLVKGTELNINSISKILQALRHVHTVDISANKVGGSKNMPDLINALQDKPDLQYLGIAECQLDKGELCALVRAVLMGHNSTADIGLNLSGNELDDSAYELLGGIFGSVPCVEALKELELRGSNVSAEGITNGLYPLLKPGGGLNTLVFSNKIPKDSKKRTVAAAVAFVKFVNSIQTLRRLVFPGNSGGCSVDFLEGVLRGMESNRFVEELKVSSNPLAVQGGRAIASLLEKNKGLRYLNCDNTIIPPHTWGTIALAMKSNDTIQCLTIPWNDYRKLGEMMPQNKIAPFQKCILSIYEKCCMNKAAAAARGEAVYEHKPWGINDISPPKEFEICPAAKIVFTQEQNNTSGSSYGSGTPDDDDTESGDESSQSSSKHDSQSSTLLATMMCDPADSAISSSSSSSSSSDSQPAQKPASTAKRDTTVIPKNDKKGYDINFVTKPMHPPPHPPSPQQQPQLQQEQGTTLALPILTTEDEQEWSDENSSPRQSQLKFVPSSPPQPPSKQTSPQQTPAPTPPPQKSLSPHKSPSPSPSPPPPPQAPAPPIPITAASPPPPPPPPPQVPPQPPQPQPAQEEQASATTTSTSTNDMIRKTQPNNDLLSAIRGFNKGGMKKVQPGEATLENAKKKKGLTPQTKGAPMSMAEALSSAISKRRDAVKDTLKIDE